MKQNDFIVFDDDDVREVLDELPDTYDGTNCFRVVEIHHRLDTSRDFGSADIIPVVKPHFNPILAVE